MTQGDTAKTHGRGNTIPALSTRSRHWVFTLNNYTQNDIKNICKFNAEYVFQEETGEKGTKHLQGYLGFKNARTFSSMKKLESRAHWEICKDRIASIIYCSKEKTRTGQVYSNVDLSLYISANTTQHNNTSRLTKVNLREKIEKDIEDMKKSINHSDPIWQEITPKGYLDHSINMMMAWGE